MRTRLGSGCPYCSGRLASKTTSLVAKRRDLAKEWHHTKNGDLRPGNVTLGSNKKVWWNCSRDHTHEWQSEIRQRVRHSRCPFCASQEVRSS
jgi:DNA-directed RNA polymerase subunit RPC12/RpoP